LLSIFLCLLCLWLVLYIVRWCTDKYFMYFIVAGKGSGKSLLCANLCNQKKFRYVYSNMGVGIPLEEKYYEKDYYPDSLIIIDEAGLIHDNRDFKNFPKEAVQFFKYSRKRRLTILLTSQNLDVDKKIRQLIDFIVLPRKFLFFVVAFKYKQYVAVGNVGDKGNEGDEIVDRIKLCGLLKVLTIPRTVAKSEGYDTGREV